LRKTQSADPALEAQLEKLDAWLKGQGVAVGSIRSYKSHIRAFARWLYSTTGKALTQQAVGRRELEAYREHLESEGQGWGQIKPRLGAVRVYVRWALATGRLKRDPFASRTPEVLGLDDFLAWLRSQGLGLHTVQHHRSGLLAYATWYESQDGRGLTPAAATPENFRQYLQAAPDDRTASLRKQIGSPALRWYSRWAEEAGHLEGEAFGRLRWRDRRAIEAWLAERGKPKRTRSTLLAAMGQFAHWYLERRGRRLTPEAVAASDVQDYLQSMRGQGKPIGKELFGLRRWAAYTYLKWAAQRMAQVEDARQP